MQSLRTRSQEIGGQGGKGDNSVEQKEKFWFQTLQK